MVIDTNGDIRIQCKCVHKNSIFMLKKCSTENPEQLNTQRTDQMLFCQQESNWSVLCVQTWNLERFGKPNFSSTQRQRMMTGFEIETWTEKCCRAVWKFRSTWPQNESKFCFGLISCRSQNLTSGLKFSSLVSGVRQFSLVTGQVDTEIMRSLTRTKRSFGHNQCN